MQWRYEPMYVLRNDQGVAVVIQEEQPEGFVTQEGDADIQDRDTLRYRVIGD